MFVDNLVSVIVPVYNSEKHILETLNSILNQTYKEIEIIIIDDCSNDSTSNIISEFGYSSKIVYFLMKANVGAAVARNKGLSLARGRYVAFIDSDDLWNFKKIEKQIQLLKTNVNVSFCFTAYDVIDDLNRYIKRCVSVSEKLSYRDLLKRTEIATSTVLIDREKLDDFRMPLRRTGQDYACWLELLKKNKYAHGIDEILASYRRSCSSLSSNKFQNIRDIWEIQTQNEGLSMLEVIKNLVCYLFYVIINKA